MCEILRLHKAKIPVYRRPERNQRKRFSCYFLWTQLFSQNFGQEAFPHIFDSFFERYTGRQKPVYTTFDEYLSDRDDLGI